MVESHLNLHYTDISQHVGRYNKPSTIVSIHSTIHSFMDLFIHSTFTEHRRC